MKAWERPVVWSATLLLLSGCGGSGHERAGGGKQAVPRGQGPTAEVTCRTIKGDPIEAIPEGTGVVFRIMYKHEMGGIGGAEVGLIGGDWPRPMRLEFVNFGNLEDLSLVYDNLNLHTSVKSKSSVDVYLRQENGGYWDKIRDNEFRMPLKEEGGTISVELPSNLFTRNVKTFTLGWIDAYR